MRRIIVKTWSELSSLFIMVVYTHTHTHCSLPFLSWINCDENQDWLNNYGDKKNSYAISKESK